MNKVLPRTAEIQEKIKDTKISYNDIEKRKERWNRFINLMKSIEEQKKLDIFDKTNDFSTIINKHKEILN